MQWILNFNCHFLLLSISPRHFTLHLEFILCISDVDFTWIFYDTNLNPDPDNILIACTVYNVQCTSWTGNLSYFPLGKISASRERENLSRPTTARLAAVMERHTLYTGTATDMVCYIHRHCLIYIISHIDIFAHKYIWYYIYIFTRPTQKKWTSWIVQSQDELWDRTEYWDVCITCILSIIVLSLPTYNIYIETIISPPG